MVITWRELWTVIHGMGLGSLFFIAFSGILVALWSLHPERVAAAEQRVRQLGFAIWTTALILWATVITRTYCLYLVQGETTGRS